MRKNEEPGLSHYRFRIPGFLLIMKLVFIMAVINVLTLPVSAADLNIQQQRITGTVTDGKTGEPLGGVVVQVKGTLTGEITLGDGTYSINVTADAAALLFSFVGYQPQEVPISGRSVIDVVMAEEVTALDEVVVIGYGTQKKSLVTGAIASVSSEDIKNSSVTTCRTGSAGKSSRCAGYFHFRCPRCRYESQDQGLQLKWYC